MNTIKQSDFQSFAEFYPYYLQEHGNPTCRRLHVVGTTLLLVLLATIITGALSAWWLFALPVVGYGFAWVGHYFSKKPSRHLQASLVQPDGRLCHVQRHPYSPY